jgi:alpha-methylacyl-CoA racemase
LTGLRVVELAGIGPAPFAGMLLADLGAEVLRIDRPGGAPVPGMTGVDPHGRGKRSVVVDLKRPGGADVVLALVRRADVLLEGFRPGVVERLGVGPEQCHAVNPGLVYGRMTGWGQDGPLAGTAGHDLTYLALSGVLDAIGPAGGPSVPPLNVAGDYGGGAMILVVGVLAALWRRAAAPTAGTAAPTARGAAPTAGTAAPTGAEPGGAPPPGEVIDAAILDGAALLATQVYGLRHDGGWHDERGTNLLDGGAPHYGVYETADRRQLAIGPLEPRFWARFVAGLGVDPGDPYDREAWPQVRARIAARIATRTREAWLSVFDGTDACVAPVLSMGEAAGNAHPHLAARQTFTEIDRMRQPAPAPRFRSTPTAVPAAPPGCGEHTREALMDWGVPDVPGLLAAGVVWQRPPDKLEADQHLS